MCAVPYSLLLVCSLAAIAQVVQCQASVSPGTACVVDPTLTKPFCQCRNGSRLYDFRSLERPQVLGKYFTATVPNEAQTNNIFYYDPCTSAPLENPDPEGTSGCTSADVLKRAAVCQHDTQNKVFVSLGILETGEGFSRSDGVVFTFNSGTESRMTTIFYKCDPSVAVGAEQMQFTEEMPKKNYSLLIRTSLACPGAAPTAPPHVHVDVSVSISLGTVLCILFFVTITVYFVAGVVYNIRFKQRTGAEAVPHLVFWSELPSLIADGARFARSGCTKSSSYETL